MPGPRRRRREAGRAKRPPDTRVRLWPWQSETGSREASGAQPRRRVQGTTEPRGVFMQTQQPPFSGTPACEHRPAKLHLSRGPGLHSGAIGRYPSVTSFQQHRWSPWVMRRSMPIHYTSLELPSPIAFPLTPSLSTPTTPLLLSGAKMTRAGKTTVKVIMPWMRILPPPQPTTVLHHVTSGTRHKLLSRQVSSVNSTSLVGHLLRKAD